MMVVQILLFVFILSSNTGLMGDVLAKIFVKIFGKLALLVPVLIFFSFLAIAIGKFRANLSKFFLIYVIYFLTLALLARDSIRNDLAWTIEYSMVQKADGGGAVGGFVCYFLVNLIGNLGLYILYGLMIFALIVNVSPFTYGEFFHKTRGILQRIFVLLKKKV